MTRLSKRKTRLVITTEDLVRERRKLREVVIDAHPPGKRAIEVLLLEYLRRGM